MGFVVGFIAGIIFGTFAMCLVVGSFRVNRESEIYEEGYRAGQKDKRETVNGD